MIELPINIPEQIEIPIWENYTILVAEDELVNFRLLELLLRKTEVRVIHKENGEDALEFVKKEDVDLILMDLKMPVLDGYEATRMIKDIKPNVPVVALTAHSVIGEKEKCEHAGFDSFLLKPIDRKELYFLLDLLFKKFK